MIKMVDLTVKLYAAGWTLFALVWLAPQYRLAGSTDPADPFKVVRWYMDTTALDAVVLAAVLVSSGLAFWRYHRHLARWADYAIAGIPAMAAAVIAAMKYM